VAGSPSFSEDLEREKTHQRARQRVALTCALIGRKAGCANPRDRSAANVRRNNEGGAMGLSDWIGIFAIITFVGFASVFYEVATRVFDD
jgi:hypothetical protein